MAGANDNAGCLHQRTTGPSLQLADIPQPESATLRIHPMLLLISHRNEAALTHGENQTITWNYELQEIWANAHETVSLSPAISSQFILGVCAAAEDRKNQ